MSVDRPRALSIKSTFGPCMMSDWLHPINFRLGSCLLNESTAAEHLAKERS